MGKKTNLPAEHYSAASIAKFSECHVVIISNLMNFSSLPMLLQSTAHSREVAEQTLKFFRHVVYLHHTEEELELFPAAMAGAARGEELQWIKTSVERLTREHRQVESMWEELEPDLSKIAQGQGTNPDVSLIEAIVLDYGAHAAFEEAEFLPRCRTILDRTP